jgi:hypothetical protein
VVDEITKEVRNVVGKTVTPISMWPKSEPSDGAPFTITEFLALDVDVAIEKGGTYAELVASAKRETKTTTTTLEATKALDTDSAVEHVNTLRIWLDDMANWKALAESVSKGKKDREDNLLSLNALWLKIDNLIGPFSKEIERLETLQNAADRSHQAESNAA